MEDAGDRTEEATPRRRQQAEEEGQLARSAELAVAGSFLSAALVVRVLGDSAASGLRDYLGASLATAGSAVLGPHDAVLVVREAATRAATAGGALLVAGATVAATVAAAQSGLHWSPKALMPKWERLDPMANLRRLLNPAQLVETAKGMAKVALVAALGWRAVRDQLPAAMGLAQAGPAALAPFLRDEVGRLLTIVGLAYLALAVADYAWQRFRHERSLRMTRDEVRREAKEDQGDPHVRSARRRMAREMAFGQMMQDVLKASVVVTNPTHIAVAIRYDEADAPVPVVLAIGRDKVAERIKAVAAEAGIPVVENRPVARALFKSAKVGSVIPVALYLAVAEILAYVLRTRAQRGRWTGSASA